MIKVEMFPCGEEKKVELMKSLTEETARVIGCPKQAIDVVVSFVEPSNWCKGGELMSERHKKG